MAGKKAFLMLITAVLLISAITAIEGPVFAGKENDPEINDSTGDTSLAVFQDIDKVWFDNEENKTIDINLKVAGPPKAWEPREIIDQQVETMSYEVYFDVGSKHYAVAVSVPFARAGPMDLNVFGTNAWTWQLNEVKYGKQDAVTSEERLEGLNSNSFDAEELIFTYTLNKDSINVKEGLEGIGMKIEHTWAAIWDEDENGQNLTDAVDYAKTYSSPGRDYLITGGLGAIYEITVKVDKVNQTIAIDEAAIYTITIENVGTAESTPVNVSYSLTGTGEWDVRFNRNYTIIDPGISTKFILTIRAPADADNGSTLITTVVASIVTENHTLNSPPIVVKTMVMVNEGEEPTKDIMDTIMENATTLALVFFLLLVLILISSARRSRKRAFDEMMAMDDEVDQGGSKDQAQTPPDTLQTPPQQEMQYTTQPQEFQQPYFQPQDGTNAYGDGQQPPY